MNEIEYVEIDGRRVPIEGERNLLELIRKCGIDIPTFCYHSELSVYGACRLCIVDIEGMGIVTSCSTVPRAGMVVRTNTKEIRETRKLTVELLLADHNQNCPTCGKSGSCQLQALARRMGIRTVRFKPTREPMPIDDANPSLIRDPNRCVLCGDCVRVCSEIQGIGAIDFANRGAEVTVGPAYGEHLGEVDCVYCGQCARVCPTGAIVPRPEAESVWAAIDDPGKTVVAQVAPAVRVALGESFGMEAGTVTMGKIVAALRALGFDKVYDTSFAADLTVLEEANEFLERHERGDRMPQFTSCCPAWVKFAEHHYPDLLDNLSSCRSPQQMFGSLAKEALPKDLGVAPKDLVVVSIMPCTAKKFEAQLDKFAKNGVRDVDNVLTTQELARMIEEAGLNFAELDSESLDMPFGFKTGAGVIFGASGGVSEAALRYVAGKLTGEKVGAVEFREVRGAEGLREATVEVGGVTLRLALVHGLANARTVADRVKAGDCDYDFIEVMACPGGCIGGAGQPVTNDPLAREKRTRGIYENDKMLDVHSSQENPYVAEAYAVTLGDIGGENAHRLLHTGYQNRRRLAKGELNVLEGDHFDRIDVAVCVGTSCHLRGSQKLLSGLAKHVRERNLENYVDLKGTFCMERCDRGPSVNIGGRKMERCTLEAAIQALDEELEALMAHYTVKAGRTSYLTEEDFEDQVAASLARFIKVRKADNDAAERTPHGCEGCHAATGSGCIHK